MKYSKDWLDCCYQWVLQGQEDRQMQNGVAAVVLARGKPFLICFQQNYEQSLRQKMTLFLPSNEGLKSFSCSKLIHYFILFWMLRSSMIISLNLRSHNSTKFFYLMIHKETVVPVHAGLSARDVTFNIPFILGGRMISSCDIWCTVFSSTNQEKIYFLTERNLFI